MYILIDNYDSFTYNLYHYLTDLGVDVAVHRNDQISVDQILELRPSGIIISPGPCTPNEAGICLELIERCKGKIPVLGVCLGHQSIAQVFGAEVVRAPYVMHGKTSDVKHTAKSVFDGLPTPFVATRYHSLTVEPDSMPDCLEVTAETEDGIIMGLAHKDYCLHGVQFHPESIASEHGHALIKNFIDLADKELAHG
ncbi:MAG: aminodeoxychorismate/anthranilate synthase component II [Kordiimonadaceae bacterium]|nr:aminodeoxychorismate/anthranilate synthase component II [Kordiimonadaceae bacterium]MBO6570316.1 aminodeoxychorismate/anthranilate synthase component II [Kordiimonadaceae bacterium]MBO6965586.1 aminodeoxychorismate/anthranilate synthase component II [Kordiimonadaceae bacterium]